MIKAEELAIMYYSQILGYAVIKSPINDYLLDQEILKHISKQDFDTFIVKTMLEMIERFK